MKFKTLKEDDERFGHKAGDLFLLEEADYDPDKYTGWKVVIVPCDNAFYKTEVQNISLANIVQLLIKEEERT